MYFIEEDTKVCLINQIEVFNVALLAGVQIFLFLTARRIDDRVRAGAHDICNSISRSGYEYPTAWLATLILNSVVWRSRTMAASSEPSYSSTVAETASKCAIGSRVGACLRTSPP